MPAVLLVTPEVASWPANCRQEASCRIPAIVSQDRAFSMRTKGTWPLQNAWKVTSSVIALASCFLVPMGTYAEQTFIKNTAYSVNRVCLICILYCVLCFCVVNSALKDKRTSASTQHCPYTLTADSEGCSLPWVVCAPLSSLSFASSFLTLFPRAPTILSHWDNLPRPLSHPPGRTRRLQRVRMQRIIFVRFQFLRDKTFVIKPGMHMIAVIRENLNPDTLRTTE